MLSNVSLYRAGDAKSILSERQRIYRDAVDCSVNDPDETYTAHWEAMTAPSLGDDAAAWRIHVTTEGDRPPDADWYVILIRRGQSIASIALYRERYLLGDPGAAPIEFAQLRSARTSGSRRFRTSCRATSGGGAASYTPGMRPLARIDVITLFPEERTHLIGLLESLGPAEWRRPTVCPGWSVKDVAAHIFGDDASRLSWGRDGFSESWIDAPSFEALIAAINARNEEWVVAMRRLSPALIIELLRLSGSAIAAYFSSLDLDAIGGPVDWAGPEPAPVWLDLAREYTEMWAHQQQIRDAVGAPALDGRRLFAPVLDAYVRALPHTFRDEAAPNGTHVRLEISGEAGGAWSLLRERGAWSLYAGDEAAAAARVTLDQDTAWRLFTKGVTPQAARERARLEGDTTLASRVMQMVSVIA